MKNKILQISLLLFLSFCLVLVPVQSGDAGDGGEGGGSSGGDGGEGGGPSPGDGGEGGGASPGEGGEGGDTTPTQPSEPTEPEEPETPLPTVNSCGGIGGDYCSPTTSCPSDYIDLGPTYYPDPYTLECPTCCKSIPAPTPPPTPPPPPVTCSTTTSTTYGSTSTTHSSNNPPNARTGSSFTAFKNTQLDFDVSSSTDDNGISSYDWNFGDGSTGSGATASHTYTSHGTYTVTLTVTDNGRLATETRDIIRVTTTTCSDGTSSTSSQVTGTDTNTYRTSQLSDTDTLTVTIVNSPPELDIPEMTIYRNEQASFDITDYLSGNDDNDPITYTYSGNLNIAVAMDGTNVILIPGKDYRRSETITFTANDGYDIATDSFKVTVTDRPTDSNIHLSSNKMKILNIDFDSSVNPGDVLHININTNQKDEEGMSSTIYIPDIGTYQISNSLNNIQVEIPKTTQSKQYAFEVKVKNDQKTDTEYRYFTVNKVKSPTDSVVDYTQPISKTNIWPIFTLLFALIFAIIFLVWAVKK